MSNEGFDKTQSTGKGVNAWVWVGAKKKKTQQSQAMMPHLSIFVGTSVASTKKAERRLGGMGGQRELWTKNNNRERELGKHRSWCKKDYAHLPLAATGSLYFRRSR